jgi:exopolysaccharide production protein ExoZ
MAPTATKRQGDTRGKFTFQSIQALRAVASVVVVIYRLIYAEEVYGGGASVLGGPAHFGFAGVDMFFVISGFIMATITPGQFGSVNNAMRFLGRRAVRIFPLYWMCTTAILVVLLLRPTLLDPKLAEIGIFQSLLLLPQEGGPLLVVGWTLTYELYFYALTALTLATCSRSRVPLVIVGWACTLLLLQLLPAHTPWSKLLTSPLTFEFMAGAIAGLYWRKLPPPFAWAAIVAAVLWLVIAGVWLAEHPFHGQVDHIRVFAFGLPSALLLTGLARLEAEGWMQIPRIGVILGDASYSLYLTHLFVLSISGRVWTLVGATGTNLGNVAFAISTLVACCAVAILVHRFVERPVTSISNMAWLRWIEPDAGARSGTSR